MYIMEYYSAIRKHKILPFETRMDLENIMLSEISQTEKAMYYMISLMWDTKLKLTDTDDSWWSPEEGVWRSSEG